MWTSFAAATGGAAAGLTGLTFIVVAIRFDALAVSDEHRSRAAQTLSLYVIVTVVGALITVPQYTRALGVEMLAIALISAVILTTLDKAARAWHTPIDSLVARNEAATNGLFTSGVSADPQTVADEIVRLLRLPVGQKPLRSVVDFTNSHVDHVNGVVLAEQRDFLSRMGFAELLSAEIPSRNPLPVRTTNASEG
jgi:hypothetical protein